MIDTFYILLVTVLFCPVFHSASFENFFLGDTNKLVELLLDGYDHITDIVDEKEVSIVDVVANANQSETVTFLQSILTFEVIEMYRVSQWE